MDLLSIIIVLVVVGVIMWAVNAYIPMQSQIKKILNIVVIIVIALWLLHVFGILHRVKDIHVGNLSPPLSYLV